MKKVIIIGSGFSGLSAACYLAKAGCAVTLVEKHGEPGGRARKLCEKGFVFDMGPSWYWMPDIFENFFQHFNKSTSDYYRLTRLDPSYRVHYAQDVIDVPADYESIRQLFENIEPGAAEKLDIFLAGAKRKYELAMKTLVYKPGLSITEFIDPVFIKALFQMDLFSSMKTHIRKYFKNPLLIQLLEFPILFLGGTPGNIPALYSLMNYADIKLGTWYPAGGISSVVDAMFNLAKELGVTFVFNYNVEKIIVENKNAGGVCDDTGHSISADTVLSSADYHFTENLLPKSLRSYSEEYWDKRVMAPSCLIYYVGLKKKLANIQHHTLFFDTSFEKHYNEIYSTPAWPAEPLFYVCAPSVTDTTVSPASCENLFFLVPVAAGLTMDSAALREQYFAAIVKRYEKYIGQDISDSIIYKHSYSISDFKKDYNAYKGNAYGLANTLLQTALFKPSMKSKKVNNLFYTGQLTVPGPGVPPSLISGQIAANEILKHLRIPN